MADRSPPTGKGPLTVGDLCAVAPFIDGSPISSSSDSTVAVHEPATGRPLLDIPAGSSQDVDRAVRSSRTAFAGGAWRTTLPSARKRTLHRWAELIEASASKLDALDAIEMGKPVSTPVFSAQSAAGLLHFFAEAVDKHFGDVFTSDPASTVLQTRVPRGVVAAIVPWNFPTYNAVLKVAPALAAGNCVILKPSELASQSALVLAKLALEAGLPAGVLNVVPGRGEIVGKALGEHPLIDMVTFTGSSAVGKLLLTYAGHSNMKVVSAECGGKSPHIVFDDGLDSDSVAQVIAGGLCLNQGQVCSVGSRLLVQDSLEEALVGRIVAHLNKIVVGDPQRVDTTYGPLASAVQLRKVISHVQSGAADGADLIYGGGKLLPGHDEELLRRSDHTRRGDALASPAAHPKLEVNPIAVVNDLLIPPARGGCILRGKKERPVREAHDLLESLIPALRGTNPNALVALIHVLVQRGVRGYERTDGLDQRAEVNRLHLPSPRKSRCSHYTDNRSPRKKTSCRVLEFADFEGVPAANLCVMSLASTICFQHYQ